MMMLLVRTAAVLMLTQFPYQTIDRQRDSWWECSHAFRQSEGESPLSGRLFRNVTLDGASWSEHYGMWGPDMRVEWQLVELPRGSRHQVSSLLVQIPMTPSRNGGEIHGDLFGDGELIATTIMLDAHSARLGRSAGSAFFVRTTFASPLAERDRWAFVARHADGTQIVRRDLPVPDRAARERAYDAYRSAIDTAWAERDENRLVTTPADALPSDRATCLLSTPAAREEIEQSSIASH